MELPEWAKALPEALHDLPHLATAKTVDEFKAQVSNDAQWRGQSIRIPSGEAGQEDWDQFNHRLLEKVPGLVALPREDDQEGHKALWTRLGRPTEATAYSLTEGQAFNGDIDSLKAYAYNANLTNAQFRALADQLNTSNTQAADATKTELDAGMKTLKAEWGQAYDDRMASVAKLLEDAPPYILQALNEGRLPADQIRYFHKWAGLAAENANIAPQDTASTGKLTPEEAGHVLRELEAKHRGIKQSDPDWQRYVDRRVELVGMTMG